MAIPVAIVAYGWKNPWYAAIDKRITESGGHVMDLTKLLPHDPQYNNGGAGAPRARWAENAAYDNTVAAVMVNPEYAEKANSAFEEFVLKLPSTDNPGRPEGMIAGFRCKTGYHRASVTAHTFSDLLNSVRCDDDSKMFAATVFDMQCKSKADAAHYMMDDVVKWVKEAPWMEPPLVVISELFGKTATGSCSEAHVNWKAIVDFQPRMEELCRKWYDGEAESDAAPVAPSTAPTTAPLVPPPPPPPRSTGEHSIYKRDKAKNEQPRSPPPKRLPATAKAAPPQGGKTRMVPQQPTEPPPARPSGCKRKLEEWQTLDFDVNHWVNTLVQFGVDQGAQKSLFLLAQLGEDGAWQANAIISKLLKKSADGEEIRNASAIVHTSCKAARHQLMPLEEGKRHNYASWEARSSTGQW